MNEQIKEYVEKYPEEIIKPKGMLQLRAADELPEKLLRRIFAETLNKD